MMANKRFFHLPFVRTIPHQRSYRSQNDELFSCSLYNLIASNQNFITWLQRFNWYLVSKYWSSRWKEMLIWAEILFAYIIMSYSTLYREAEAYKLPALNSLPLWTILVMQPPLFFQQKCTAPCNHNHSHLRDNKLKQSWTHCVPSKTEKRKTTDARDTNSFCPYYTYDTQSNEHTAWNDMQYVDTWCSLLCTVKKILEHMNCLSNKRGVVPTGHQQRRICDLGGQIHHNCQKLRSGHSPWAMAISNTHVIAHRSKDQLQS